MNITDSPVEEKLAVGARKKNDDDDDACKPVGARYTRPPLLLLLLLWSKCQYRWRFRGKAQFRPNPTNLLTRHRH